MLTTCPLSMRGYGLAVGFLQALQLPLVVFRLGPQHVLRAALAVFGPAPNFRWSQIELVAGRGHRRLALDDLKDQRRLAPGGPALDLFFHYLLIGVSVGKTNT